MNYHHYTVNLIEPHALAYFGAHGMITGGLLLAGRTGWAAVWLIFWGLLTFIAVIRTVG